MITNLEKFTEAYIDTALWSSSDDDGNPLEWEFSRDDISAECLATMKQDCNLFLYKHQETIQEAIDSGGVRCGPDFEEWGHAGHDFWLTRNGHGAGFWDGDWPGLIGDVLNKFSREWAEANLYIGDDGRIYV